MVIFVDAKINPDAERFMADELEYYSGSKRKKAGKILVVSAGFCTTKQLVPSVAHFLNYLIIKWFDIV